MYIYVIPIIIGSIILSIVSESKSLSPHIYIYIPFSIYSIVPLQKSFHGVSNIHRYKYIYIYIYIYIIMYYVRRASHLFSKRARTIYYNIYNNDKRDRLMRFAAGADSTPQNKRVSTPMHTLYIMYTLSLDHLSFSLSLSLSLAVSLILTHTYTYTDIHTYKVTTQFYLLGCPQFFFF